MAGLRHGAIILTDVGSGGSCLGHEIGVIIQDEGYPCVSAERSQFRSHGTDLLFGGFLGS